MSSITDKQRQEYMNQIRTFVISDLERGIKEGLNFLVALGLSTYTEVLGGICFGNLQSNHEQNYIRFIKRYFDKKCGNEYMKLEKQLCPLGRLYGTVRSGLVHRYWFHRNNFVATRSVSPLRCSIRYTPQQIPEQTFVVKEYFEHFKCAFDRYYDDLITKKDVYLVRNFDKAITRSNLI
jgi:hypothetical protein